MLHCPNVWAKAYGSLMTGLAVNLVLPDTEIRSHLQGPGPAILSHGPWANEPTITEKIDS